MIDTSPLLEDIDESNAEQIFERIADRWDLPEWWAGLVLMIKGQVEEAIERGDASRAAWGMAYISSLRSMLTFREHLEEPVWRAYRLGRLHDALELWQANVENSNEEFWYQSLQEHAFVLSQVFASPMVVLRGKAYVGGTSVESTGGKFVDFLASGSLSKNAALIEIKTPMTRLLGRRYRGVFNASAELTGAVLQIADYKDSLVKDHDNLLRGTEQRFEAFDPECVVIVGRLTEASDYARRKSFELYRRGLRDVQIITYDELFGKVESLIALLEERAPKA